MEKEGIIYLLSDPLTKEPKYVGMTINIESRYAQHLWSKTNDLRSIWIRQLKEISLKPVLSILERCEYFMAPAREHFYIRKYRSEGYSLLNNIHHNTTPTVGSSFELRPDLKCLLHNKAKKEGICFTMILNSILDEYFNQ